MKIKLQFRITTVGGITLATLLGSTMLTTGFFNTNGFAQAGLWQANTGSIVFTSRNTGILTNDPSAALDVNGRTRTRGNAVFDSSAAALSMIAQQAHFAVALVTGQLTAGGLTVNGNAIVNGQLSAGNITISGSSMVSSSGNLDFGNNNLTTTGNLNANNITASGIVQGCTTNWT